MKPLVVVENTRRFPFRIPGVRVVSARDYLIDPGFSEGKGLAVYNLCRTYGYQTLGYYVSLLAAARDHRPLPSVDTMQELRLLHPVRLASEELDPLIQRSLRPLRGQMFELSVYFGRNVTRRYDRLSNALFKQFPVPFLRARFVKDEEDEEWVLDRLRPIATSEIPDGHRDFVLQRATEYLARPRRARRTRQTYRYDLAILVNPSEAEPPSDERAIRRFIRAAREVGMEADVIEPEDLARVAEFDALFLRETTLVEHHTFRFAKRAAAEGLVVVDDPQSIVRCTNKVFLAESFARRRIPTPRTLVVEGRDAEAIEQKVGLPCVLKRPDSSFSEGVVLARTAEELRASLSEVLKRSQLAIAQEWLPSDFDWRIGVLAGKALYACRYFMARGHWQIVRRDGGGGHRYGRVEAVPLGRAPRQAIELAIRSAGLIGDGLYGVDIKEVEGRFYVMEVNDNPNIDAGYEDGVLGDALYLAIMRWFRRRLDARGAARSKA